jgi:hypothetical protein
MSERWEWWEWWGVSVGENEDIFLSEVWGGGQVGVRKREKGRAPQPIFVRG